MSKIQLGLAPTSNKIRVKLMNSTVTTGAGITGLTNASAGLIISTIQMIEGASGEAAPVVYTVTAGNVETIATLGTYAAPTASKCRFKEVDATNHPGVYEIQLADARFSATGDATKAMTLLISVSGAANLAQADVEIECRNQAAIVASGGITTASFASGAINGAAIATDAIGSDEIAASAVTKIQAGLATPTNITAGTIANITNERSKYMNGAVWINAGGAAGTVNYTNGIMTNPVTGIANAKTIADSLLLKKFYTQAGTTVTLVATMDGYVFDGVGWLLALGGQTISNAVFMNAKSVTGVSSSSAPAAAPTFIDCEFGATATLPASNLHGCEFGGTVTFVGGGNYDFVDCASIVAGTSTPIFDIASVVNTNVSFRRWSGGITINNIVASTVISIDVVSGGTVTLNGVGGNVQVRGMCAGIVDNRTGSPTLGQNAVVNQTTLESAIRSATAQAGSAVGFIVLDASASSIDNLYNGCRIKIHSGTGAGQSRTVVLYNGTSKNAYTDTPWVTTPDNTSVFIIYAGQCDPEILHSGIATAGAGGSVTLAATASAVNAFYDGASITIVSGQGVGQTRIVGTYDGATKIASLTDGWATAPNNTSVYVVRGIGDVVTGGFSSGALSAVAGAILVTPANKLATDATGAAFSDVSKINTSATAAVQLEKSANTIVSGTVNIVDFAPTTTEFETADLTNGATDFYKYRTVIMASGTLDNQAREIVASSYNAGTLKTHITVKALTAAPVAGVAFNIV